MSESVLHNPLTATLSPIPLTAPISLLVTDLVFEKVCSVMEALKCPFFASLSTVPLWQKFH